MKARHRVCVPILAGLLVLGSSRVEGVTLYATTTNGPDGVSSLYTIDSQTGVATFVGSTGFQRISAIELSAGGVLYGTAERNDGSDTPVLIKINRTTGAGTEVGVQLATPMRESSPRWTSGRPRKS